MEDLRWRRMRESGFRVLFAGIFSLVIAFVLYSRLTVPSSDLAVPTQHLTNLAYAILAITAASMASAMYGAYTILRSEQVRTAGSSSLMSFVSAPFQYAEYRKIVIVVAIAYGVLFGFLSQILVYRADVSFTERGIPVPSIDMIPCCSAPGYVPMLTVYITDHFLILVIPVNVILAAIVSALVGFNVALGIYAYRQRKSMQARTSFVGGIGATSGFFVGCPTCAGSIFSALLGMGVAGAGTSATALAPFQTFFIAVSIPALLVAPFLMARTIKSISSCKLS
jgi:hypothetical protein